MIIPAHQPGSGVAPVCPHRMCGRPMLPTQLAGVFECPHVHRPRSVRLVDEPNYLASFLPRDDNGPRPSHEPKRSSAPWRVVPDRGPLVLRPQITRHRRRGQR